MADLTQIQSDSSLGLFNARQAENATSYTPAPVPLSAQEMAREAAGSQVTKAFPLDNPKYYFRIELADYNRTSLFAAQQVSFAAGGTDIKLPVPLQLRNHLTAGWNTKPLGLIGTLAAQGVSSALQNPTPGNIAAGGALVLGAAAVQKASTAAGGPQAGPVADALQAAGSLAGVALSRFVVVTYEGPQYKRHSFTWKLVPRNPEEAESIRLIVKELHNAACPTLLYGGVVFGFPKIIRMSFMPNSKYMFKFKPAVLTSVMAEYSSGGQPAFMRKDAATSDENGQALNAPEGITLNIQALELEYWLRGNVTDTNDPFDVYNNTESDLDKRGTIFQPIVNGFNAILGQGNAEQDLTR